MKNIRILFVGHALAGLCACGEIFAADNLAAGGFSPDELLARGDAEETDEDATAAFSVPEGSDEPLKEGQREDGPTVAEYVAAGYLAENYPPTGYASRSTPEEIAAAIATAKADAAPKADSDGNDGA